MLGVANRTSAHALDVPWRNIVARTWPNEYNIHNCYIAGVFPIHWLVHDHMTSNDETVCRQMP